VVSVVVYVLLGLVTNLASETLPDQWKPWSWVPFVVLTMAAVGFAVRSFQHDGQIAPRGGALGLAEATEQLVQAVGVQCRREEERRRVHDPLPLPVRWHLAPEHLTDHWANIRRAPAGITPGPLALTGQLDRMVDVYRRIPSGRLVVLGRAGSGKTILALRFVLDLFDTYTSTDRVPVIFSLGSWNPTGSSLRAWLTDQLVRDYPALAGPGLDRASLAAALVNEDRILPVLDGFDEIADGLHQAALEALNEISMPLLLTSRPEEYVTVVSATDVLTAAACIELDDLTLADLTGYLPRTSHKITASNEDTTTVWDPVLACLRDHPGSPGTINLAAVLSTPLMVMLARTIYSDTPGRDPVDLLDTDRFGTPQAIEDHLLDVFVTAIYQRPPLDQYAGRRRHRRWAPDRVEHWLSHFAWHLDRLGTRDLAWWQLANTIPRSVRVFASGVMFALIFGLANGLIFGFVYGLGIGLIFGLAYGLVSGLRTAEYKPSYLQLQIRSRARPVQMPRKIMFGFLSGLGKGLTIGFVLGFLLSFVGSFSLGTVGKFMDLFTSELGDELGLMFGLGRETRIEIGLWLQDGIMGGLMFGLGFGLVGGLISAFVVPIDIRAAVSPSKLLTTNRQNVMFQSLGFGLVGGLVSAFIFGLDAMLVNVLTIGFLGGLLVIVVSGLGGNAWGQWLIFSRVWLPLTGRLPWTVLGFLEDAYQRGVLRQSGAVYQFRHARLQNHLTHVYQARRGSKRSVSRRQRRKYI
jgi:GTPase SAR1 family protein